MFFVKKEERFPIILQQLHTDMHIKITEKIIIPILSLYSTCPLQVYVAVDCIAMRDILYLHNRFALKHFHILF